MRLKTLRTNTLCLFYIHETILYLMKLYDWCTKKKKKEFCQMQEQKRKTNKKRWCWRGRNSKISSLLTFNLSVLIYWLHFIASRGNIVHLQITSDHILFQRLNALEIISTTSKRVPKKKWSTKTTISASIIITSWIKEFSIPLQLRRVEHNTHQETSTIPTTTNDCKEYFLQIIIYIMNYYSS